MKITIEHYDNKYTMECSDETTLSDLLRDLGNLLKLVGYCFDGELDIVDNEEQESLICPHGLHRGLEDCVQCTEEADAT
jgi:hypothetical protein